MKRKHKVSSRSMSGNITIVMIVATVLAAAGVTGLANDDHIEKIFLECRFAFMGEPPVDSKVDVDEASTEDEAFVEYSNAFDESPLKQGPVFFPNGDLTQEELENLFKERASSWVSLEEMEKDSNGEVVIFDRGTVYIDHLTHAEVGE